MAKSKTTTQKPQTTPTNARTPVTVVTIAKPTVAAGNGSHDRVYEDAIKELKALSENDTYAKKIDNGPLSEARGKDTWRLHAQLRAIDQVDKNLSRHVSGLKTALHDIDDHLHTDAASVVQLLHANQAQVGEWVTGTRDSLSRAVSGTRDTLSAAISETRSQLQKTLTSSTSDLHGEIEGVGKALRDAVAKLAKATAGSEENLRTQTESFAKAMEGLLSQLQSDFDRKIVEFRDEATRLIDRRFNQTDVAFAAVRADQEVIKALLTDIIKDRLGRAESRSR